MTESESVTALFVCIEIRVNCLVDQDDFSVPAYKKFSQHVVVLILRPEIRCFDRHVIKAVKNLLYGDRTILRLSQQTMLPSVMATIISPASDGKSKNIKHQFRQSRFLIFQDRPFSYSVDVFSKIWQKIGKCGRIRFEIAFCQCIFIH